MSIQTRGVSYVGYPVKDLAYLDPEAVIFLLYNKQLPSDDELAAFKANLAERAKLDPRVIQVPGPTPVPPMAIQWNG